MAKHDALIREMVAAKRSKADMARTLGVGIFAINSFLKRSALEHGGNQWTTRKFKTHPIIQQLRDERINSGFTFEEFAKKIGYDKSLISEWERGTRRLHFPGLVDFANALGYEVIVRPVGS